MGRKIWTRAGIPALATATAFCSWMALSPAQADSTFRVPSGATSILVEGQGFGHGHGMSQYGAKAAAEKGLSQRQIMAFYFPGTSAAQAGGAIRVQLSTRNKLVVRNHKSLRVKRSGGQLMRLAKVTPRAARAAKLWRAVPSGTRTLVQFKKGSTWKTKWRWSGDVEFSAGSQPVTVRAGSDSGTFRGAVRLARTKAGGSDRDIVNRVSLEHYVRGVVAREMPALWAPAAVQAQAVAARTYAVHERETTDRGHFDVYDTVWSQVYGGVGAETTPSNKAVAATRGEIRSHQGKAAFTQFSSSNGGWMLGNNKPYLKSGRDPYDPVSTWQVRIPLERFQERFGSTYPLATVQIVNYRQAGNWVETVKLTGTNGKTNTMSGSAFRTWAGLKSASFEFND